MKYICCTTQAEKRMLALGSLWKGYLWNPPCMRILLIFKTKLKVKPENRISPFAK